VKFGPTGLVVVGLFDALSLVVTQGDRFMINRRLVVGWSEEPFGPVVVVDAGLTGIQVCRRDPFNIGLIVDPGSTRRLSGGHAKPSSSTLVCPPSAQSRAAWCTWAP
jgi:hypothetical protein